MLVMLASGFFISLHSPFAEVHKLTFLHDKIINQVMVIVVNSSDANVLFKAFGCLRLLSAKAGENLPGSWFIWHTTSKETTLSFFLFCYFFPEICRHIVQTESVVEKICQFCDNTGLPQIKTEGSRLLASLVKNSNSQGGI